MSRAPSATTLKSLFEPSCKTQNTKHLYIYIIYHEYSTGCFATMQISKLHEWTNLSPGLTTAALADLPVESCLVFHFCHKGGPWKSVLPAVANRKFSDMI